MKYSIPTMMNRKNSYLETNLLFHSMYAYDYNNGDQKDNLSVVDYYCTEVVDGLMLPSNRYGTPLAIALETHLFKSALYILENLQRFGISLDRVLIDDDLKDVNLAQEYDFALSYFSTQEEQRKVDMISKFFGEERGKEEQEFLRQELEAFEKVDKIVEQYKEKIAKRKSRI
ncbi:MAG: hypothetical protein IK997_00530 [Bacilli bacterium]|nr:hypothetical protein [Bacilli bacterium]